MQEFEKFVKKCHSFCGAPFTEPYLLDGTEYIGWFQPKEVSDYSLAVCNCLFQDYLAQVIVFAESFCPNYRRLPSNWQKVMVCLAYRDIFVLNWDEEKLIQDYSTLIRNLNSDMTTSGAVSLFLIPVATRHISGTYEDTLSTHVEKALFNLV